MNTLPRDLRSELLGYYGYRLYARRAAPAVWPVCKLTGLQINVGSCIPAVAAYIERMVALGCRASLKLICRISESHRYDLLLGPAVKNSVCANDIRMVRYVLHIADKKMSRGYYIGLIYMAAEHAASIGRPQILRYCREQLLLNDSKGIGYYDLELTAIAAAEGQVACMLMGLRDWKSKSEQHAMFAAAESAQYETFQLCHKRGGRITDELLSDMNREYHRMLDSSQHERLAEQKAIAEYCHAWYEYDKKFQYYDRTMDHY